MKTNRTDLTLLLVRMSLGIVIGAHGAQKLLGWFDGYGFEGTMGYFTQSVGLPYVLALSIIFAESLGMIALMLGLLSRFISSGLIAIMTGAIVTTHGQHGFFMNWSGTQGGEGFELHLLVIALSAVVLINGAGKYSLDHLLFDRKLVTRLIDEAV